MKAIVNTTYTLELSAIERAVLLGTLNDVLLKRSLQDVQPLWDLRNALGEASAV